MSINSAYQNYLVTCSICGYSWESTSFMGQGINEDCPGCGTKYLAATKTAYAPALYRFYSFEFEDSSREEYDEGWKCIDCQRFFKKGKVDESIFNTKTSSIGSISASKCPSCNKDKVVHAWRNNQANTCFIASACYQNIDAPEVDLLRQFRDTKLLPTKIGHLFVNLYYRVSPPIAEWLSRHHRIAGFIKVRILNPIVWAIRSWN